LGKIDGIFEVIDKIEGEMEEKEAQVKELEIKLEFLGLGI
jgi:hypothetical protein